MDEPVVVTLVLPVEVATAGRTEGVAEGVVDGVVEGVVEGVPVGTGSTIGTSGNCTEPVLIG